MVTQGRKALLILVIWDSLNPALMLIHGLQHHAAGVCDTGLS